MFIRVCLCLLWYLFGACLLVDAVLLAVICAAFSAVSDLLWALTLSQAGEQRGGGGHIKWLSDHHPSTRPINDAIQTNAVHWMLAHVSCWDGNDKEFLVWPERNPNRFTNINSTFGSHLNWFNTLKHLLDSKTTLSWSLKLNAAAMDGWKEWMKRCHYATFRKGFCIFFKENTSVWINMETLFNVLHVS